MIVNRIRVGILGGIFLGFVCTNFAEAYQNFDSNQPAAYKEKPMGRQILQKAKAESPPSTQHDLTADAPRLATTSTAMH